MKSFVKWLMYFLYYIVTTVILAFLFYKIFGITVEHSYTYILLGVLTSEIATLRVNENDKKEKLTK